MIHPDANCLEGCQSGNLHHFLTVLHYITYFGKGIVKENM